MVLQDCSCLIGSLETRKGEPHVAHYRDVVYRPVIPQRLGYDTVLDWGLYTTHGALIHEGAYMRGPNNALVGQSAELPPDLLRETECVTEECVYLGPLYGHYGHHLISSIARTWFALKRPKGRFVFHSYLDLEEMLSRDFIRQTFEAAGINRSDMIVPTRPTLFKNLIVPAPSFQELSFGYEAHSATCRDIGKRLLSSRPQSRSERPIFLSKRNLTSGVWRFTNEAALADELERRGIEIVDPERLSFPEQIDLFNSHESISGVAGSGLHTSMFSNQPVQGVGLYFEEAIQSNFLIADRISENVVKYVCPREVSREPDNRLFHFQCTIGSPDKVAAAIAGLIYGQILERRNRGGFRTRAARAVRSFWPLRAKKLHQAQT